MSFIFLAILITTIISSIFIIFSNYKQSFLYAIIIILFFTTINYVLYKLLDSFYESMFFNPILDLLVINLVVMLGINYHFKFWYLYLIIPGYGFYKLSMWAYEHVKNAGKPIEGEDVNTDLNNKIVKKNKEKEKKKIIRY